MSRRVLACVLLLASLAAPAYAETTPTPDKTTTTTRVKHIPVPSVGEIADGLQQRAPQLLTWQSAIDWKSLSKPQKELYVEGYFDGLCAMWVLEAFDKSPESQKSLNLQKMRAGLHAHRDEVIAKLDEGFAQHPNESAAVLTAAFASIMMPTEETETTTGPATPTASPQ